MDIAVKDWRRLLILALVLLLLFCAIIAQFYRVQIIEGNRWQKKARAQHQFTVVDPFKRGRFFATTSVSKHHIAKKYPLALDLKSYHLYADPFLLPSHCHEKLIAELSPLLMFEQKKKEVALMQLKKKSRSQRLKPHLTKEEKKTVDRCWQRFSRQHQLPRRGLYWIEDYRRSYPYGSLFGVALGGVQDERDPTTRQHIPTGGMELFFDRELSGQSGKRQLLRSPRQPLASETLVTSAENGEDIYLTIDPYIQTIAEEELKFAVERVQAKGGWAVMMDPRTGEIYALAQYPEFDPMHYRTYYNDPNLASSTRVRAATDCFEPGSTFKAIGLAVAFLANKECAQRGEPPLFDPLEMVPCDLGIFPGRKRALRDVGGPHYFLNFKLAIQKSSSIYMAHIARRVIDHLGTPWYREQLKEIFKFGVKTGIELPGEASGFLPNPSKGSEWSKATSCSLPMGYNILVNTFQMLRAYAILATGKDVHPTLIKGGGKEKGEEVFDRAISREMVNALKLTTKPGGTGSRADIPGYTEAGKSGTAEKVVDGQYSRRIHFSSFIGFTPAENPQFLLFIGIDEPIYFLPGVGRTYLGGMCAAPAFKKIMQRTLDYVGLPLDDPYGYPYGDPRFDREKADGVKEAAEAKKLYSEWNRK